MLRLFWLVIAALVTAVVACFAVANRAPVEVSLWPLPIVHALPFYLVVLGTLVAGVLLGGIATWLAGFRARARAARDRRQRVELEARERLRRQQAEAAELARARERRSRLPAPAAAA